MKKNYFGRKDYSCPINIHKSSCIEYKHALIIHSCQFYLTLVGIVWNMPECPSPVNNPASVQQILEPLQGSVEQAAPPTTSPSQAGATSGTTVNDSNASQNSSQDNATGSNVSNNSTVPLKVFCYNVLVLYSGHGFLVISCCLMYISSVFFLLLLFMMGARG